MTSPPERPRGLLINTWIASELVDTVLARNLAEDGIDSSFYGTLSVIGVWGPLTPSDVAEKTGTPLTTVSDRLRRMVAAGDVERVAHPDDGRSHRVQLTKAVERADALPAGEDVELMSTVIGLLRERREHSSDSREVFQRLRRSHLCVS